ncbi:MAG: phosphomethylpyrimidine synthase [Candidatus Cloacimonadota bacterium]|nr:phosphomethylpyrimidine synthase [Candidatus Cloacimonadota bacterium]
MTQLSQAKSGIITEQMQSVAKYENIDPDSLRALIAQGKVVIPHNVHSHAQAMGIGKHMKVKINANIGCSDMGSSLDEELQKLEICKRYQADSVMDLSTGSHLHEIRKKMRENTDLILGTVPIYAVAAQLEEQGKDIRSLEANMLFDEIQTQAEEGIDFITVHAGINRFSLDSHLKDKRTLGVVSRGGSLLKRWMLHKNSENPLYEEYDRLLKICSEHDVTLSLGDGLRPGALSDATDSSQIGELIVLAELARRAREAGVQVMIEGPGHIPLNEIQANMELQKCLCDDAPFYVLGPLPTDIACGYDHISGAIGAALAAWHGADFLCYLTPAEHLCLPDLDDVKQGIIATRIAAHVADIARGHPHAREIDDAISQARRKMDWEKIFALSLDPDLSRRRKNDSSMDAQDHCSMCGNLCAIKTDKAND